jgi:NAD(P)-dependent dehydrogenase (short-subunit alcohol dehydrogenase family)
MGRATSLVFAAGGAKVSILDRDEPGAEATALSIRAAGGQATVAVCDVTSQSDVDRAFSEVEATYGPVYGLAAAAGVLDAAFTDEADAPEVFRRVMSVNVEGVYLTNRRAALSMIGGGQGGRIVNWSSLAARMGTRGHAAYCASKAAVESFTRVLAVEWAHHGILVNAVALGPVATPMLGMNADSDRGRAEIPLGRVAEPEQVAAIVAFLMGPDGSYVTGSVMDIDGGMNAARGSWSEEQARERLRRLHGRESH